jgi:isochorismate synthase
MRAVTRPLDHDVDLNDIARGDGLLFVRDGVGVAARGVATRVSLADAPGVLAAIDHDDAVGVPGSGPLALGVVPFLPGAPTELIIPSLIVGKGPGGERWLTVIDDADADLTVPPRPTPSVATFQVRPGIHVATYLAAVTAARDAVRAGDLVKAVIARDVIVDSDQPFDVHAVLLRLRTGFGSSYRYSVDGFVGASPELLVEVRDGVVRSHPLAGTAPRTGDPSTDARLAQELVASTKNQVEHRVVIDVVNDTLLRWCSYLDWEPEPQIVAVANVQHLGTRVEGPLSRPWPNVLDLVQALSPTPALGGHPRDAALALIHRVEGFDRGRYGGAVGWVDSRGNGVWAVAIRCAEFSDDRRRARLFAGGGIVAESEPLAELAETQAKFQAMLSALVRP